MDKKRLNNIFESKRVNRDGQSYAFFDSNKRSKAKKRIFDYVEKLNVGLQNMYPDLTQEERKKISHRIIETFEKSNGFRIDEKDSGLKHWQGLYKDDDKWGGVTFTDGFDGRVSIVIPAVMSDLKLSPFSKDKNLGKHTFFHEMIHAMSSSKRENFVTQNKEDNKMMHLAGIRTLNNGILADLNEGFTEYYARKVLGNYVKNPERNIEGRHIHRVQLVEKIIAKLPEDKKKDLFLSYVLGQGDKSLEIINSIKNPEEKGFADYLLEKYPAEDEKGRDVITDEKHRGREFDENDKKLGDISKDMESFKYPEKQISVVSKDVILEEKKQEILLQEERRREFLEIEKANRLKQQENKSNEIIKENEL